MSEYSKQYYKLSEVSSMLNLPSSTINYWVMTFDELDPPTTKGGHRRYRPDDIELIRQIQVMMHDKGMQIEGAKKMLKNSRPPYRGFKCKSADDALSLIAEVCKMVRDNPRAISALEAMTKWVENMDKPVLHKNVCEIEHAAE